MTVSVETVNQAHGRRLEVKRELVEIKSGSLLAATTLEVGTIGVIGVLSAVGRLTVDQECTINTWYGSDGSEETTPQSSVVAAGASVPFVFNRLEDTLRIELVAGGVDITDLNFSLYGIVEE